MAIYHYQSGSLLDSAYVLTNQTGGKRAYLHGATGASSEQLRKIKIALRDEGYTCVPTVHEGEPVLEVRGFGKDEELLSRMRDLGLVQGEPTALLDTADIRTKGEKAKSHPLFWAGLSYNVGDAAYMTYTVRNYFDGLKQAGATKYTHFFNKVDIAAGVGYGVGSLALTKYGGRDQSQNTIDAANKKMYAYFRKENIGVDDGSTLHATMQEPKRGFFAKLDRFLGKFPSETLSSIYIFVGAGMAAAAFFRATRPLEEGLAGQALAKAIKGRSAEWKDVALGVTTGASGLAGIMIKEKKPVEGEPKRRGLSGVLDWIQEKPLRITGSGLFLATAIHGYGTVEKYIAGEPEVRKNVVFRGIFVVMNILSEFLLFKSSKGHGLGVRPDSSVNQTVIASTAELIMRQPKEKRENMIVKLAGYMSSREVLDGKADDIAQAMRVYVAALDHNPWTKHYVPTAKLEALPANPGSPEAEQAKAATTPGTRISGMAHLSTGIGANNNELKPSVAM